MKRERDLFDAQPFELVNGMEPSTTCDPTEDCAQDCGGPECGEGDCAASCGCECAK